jgi:integrase/recombinase XerD
MSPLNDNLADYLRLRRQLGFELKRAGQELASFVAFLEQVGADRITIELALQISELMAVAGALRPALKAATYRTVIGLLAATGIRIGEALGLDREDVSLDDGVLRLRVAKQHKQRLVPLHETSTHALGDYARARDRACRRPATAAFFFSTSGARICGSVFDQTFRKLLRQVQPEPGAEQAHRRVHDLRHTFAVNTLRRWHDAGVDVDRAMPLLSTYLGHIDPHSTYWYLHATPELMRPVASKLEGIQGGRS